MTDTAKESGKSNLLSASDRGARIFVWTTWAIMLLIALTFVCKYGSNVPFRDDWGVMVRQLTGDSPVNAAWLWNQANEHRIPLAKAIFVGLAKITGCDFRSGMIMQVFLLGIMAFAMI